MSTKPSMTCRELVEFLDDYVDEQLSPDGRATFEGHLAACDDCVAYVDGYRRTIALAHSLCEQDEAVPSEVPEDLVAAILAARRSRD